MFSWIFQLSDWWFSWIFQLSDWWFSWIFQLSDWWFSWIFQLSDWWFRFFFEFYDRFTVKSYSTDWRITNGFPVSVYKRMLRWFPTLHVATACFSCSLPDLNFLDPYFVFMYMHYNHCHRVTARLQIYYYYYYVSCHRPILPGTSLEPTVIPTAQDSSFTLQYFPYYVWCSKYSCLL